MINFTREIKRDLLQGFPDTKENVTAELSAFLSTAGSVTSQGDIIFVSENERIAEYFLRLTEYFGVRMELGEATYDPKRKRDKLTFFCGGKDAESLLMMIEPWGNVMRFAQKDGTALSYLRGAFLGGGSCTLPRGGAKTGYHLEFVMDGEEVAESFSSLLTSMELLSKLVRRGDKFVVYCKSREIISDFLSTMGASGALKRLNDVSSEREENNNFNRVSNCYAGNADKSAIASAAQVVAIGKLKEDGRLRSLPAALQETADYRLKNPADSLQELSDRLGVSKSCLNHRLRKLMQIYDNSYKH